MNKVESGVRAPYPPAGLIVECRKERSQHANKEKAATCLKKIIEEENKRAKQRRKTGTDSVIQIFSGEMLPLFSVDLRLSEMRTVMTEKNPWEEIPLSSYENHMRSDTVRQLQAVNVMMKDQLKLCPDGTVMILGIAGGNGLEHIRTGAHKKVYAIDINATYLEETGRRYSDLGGRLECIHADLRQGTDALPEADLLLANLLIEYIGYESFQNVVKKQIHSTLPVLYRSIPKESGSLIRRGCMHLTHLTVCIMKLKRKLWWSL